MTSWTPVSRASIRAMWMNQSPKLVEALDTAGALETRLDEALETANLVQGGAISRGLSPEQARELAQDAIGLAPPMR